jgi:hypothetical protein
LRVKENPLRRLESFGQSIWLDYLGRDLLSSVRLRQSIERDVQAAHRALEELQRLGIGIDEVTRRFEEEGVEKFNTAYDKLIESLGARTAERSRTSQ